MTGWRVSKKYYDKSDMFEKGFEYEASGRKMKLRYWEIVWEVEKFEVES